MLSSPESIIQLLKEQRKTKEEIISYLIGLGYSQKEALKMYIENS